MEIIIIKKEIYDNINHERKFPTKFRFATAVTFFVITWITNFSPTLNLIQIITNKHIYKEKEKKVV